MDNQHIVRQLKSLQSVTPRSEWVALNRDFLLRQISPADQSESTTIFEQVAWTSHFFSRMLFQPAVTMMTMLVVFVGSSLMVNAAFYSLPGDSLYTMKITLEKAQLALTPNEVNKVELKVEFAQKRIAEFDKVVAQTNVSPEDKQERINVVVREFQKNVGEVKDHITKINQGVDGGLSPAMIDGEKDATLRIAMSVSTETRQLAQALNDKTNALPTAEKEQVQQLVNAAVQQAQEAGQSADALIQSAGSVVPTQATTTPVINDGSTSKPQSPTTSQTLNDIRPQSKSGETTESIVGQ